MCLVVERYYYRCGRNVVVWSAERYDVAALCALIWQRLSLKKKKKKKKKKTDNKKDKKKEKRRRIIRIRRIKAKNKK